MSHKIPSSCTRVAGFALGVSFVIAGLSAAAAAAKPPSAFFDLSHWKLTLPVDAKGGTEGHATEASAKELTSGYSHSAYFFSGESDRLVCWCPVTGARTENTDYARTELREVPDPLDDNVTWPAKGGHRLQARCRVTELPSSRKVIIGQIHAYFGDAKPLIKLQFFKGRVEALVKVSPRKGKDLVHEFPTVGLGNDFDYEISLIEGVLVITVNGESHTQNIFVNDPAWAKYTYYFKAGAYVQDNKGPASEGGRVEFSRLEVSHSP